MRFLGMKGQLGMTTDSQLLPTLNLGNLADTPYLRYGIPVAESDTAAAVVGELGFVCIRPGASICLAVHQIIVPATANFMSLSVRLATFAQIAAAGSSAGVNVQDLAPDGGQLGTARSSLVQTGTEATFVGNGLFGLTVQANGPTTVYTFPGPGLILYGNDPNGRGALLVQENTANRDLHVGFVGREWPVPG